MNDRDTEDLDARTFGFVGTAQIRLYDEDAGWFDDDDFLGEVIATADQAGHGEQFGRFTRDGASYDLVFRVETS